MKSYFRRFRHVRGWYYARLLNNVYIECRINQTLTSFFELRLVYWIVAGAGAGTVEMVPLNALLRLLGTMLWNNHHPSGYYALSLSESCCSQYDYWGQTYVATYHPHPIIEKSSTVVYTEIDQNDTRRYQLNPRYT